MFNTQQLISDDTHESARARIIIKDEDRELIAR